MRFLWILSVLSLFALPAWAQGDTRFSSVVDDFPLMAAIEEVGEGVEFSTSDGRIAEFSAAGQTTPGDVLSFYKETLPQLGWTHTGDSAFVREGETLNIKFETDGDLLIVRFQFAPVEN